MHMYFLWLIENSDVVWVTVGSHMGEVWLAWWVEGCNCVGANELPLMLSTGL